MTAIDDDAWIDALVTLQQEKDARELLKLVVDHPVPPWVRERIGEWLDGKWPPEPKPLTDHEQKLMFAVAAYKREREKNPRVPSQAKLVERIAKARDVSEEEMLDYLNKGKNAASKHIRKVFESAGGVAPAAKRRTPTK